MEGGAAADHQGQRDQAVIIALLIAIVVVSAGLGAVCAIQADRAMSRRHAPDNPPEVHGAVTVGPVAISIHRR